jgi:uncharacterized protein (TIGR02300 family)
VTKPEWGTKRSCQSCGKKFYDLMRTPILCPGCGTEFSSEVAPRSRRSRPAVVAKPVVEEKIEEVAVVDEADEAEKVKVGDDELEVDLGDDDDDTLIEDTSDLGEDDDVAEVIAVAVDEDEDDR